MKKIGFRNVEEITKTIALDEYEPFDITFVLPGNDCLLNMKSATEKDEASVGEAVVKYLAACLKSWTLNGEPTLETLNAMDSVAPLIEIFDVINKEVANVKN